MLNYIVLVNKKNDVIIIDYESDNKDEKFSPEVGYETDCSDWSTDKEEYMEDNDIFFDKNKAFNKVGLYKVEGYDNSSDTPDGYCEDYKVISIKIISELKY